MQKAKEAKTVGILVGTLGAGVMFVNYCDCIILASFLGSSPDFNITHRKTLKKFGEPGDKEVQ